MKTPIDLCACLPHTGSMCLLEAVDDFDEDHIRCTAISHHDPRNPLRRAGVLEAICGLEYAAQAMAVHLVLTSPGPAEQPRAGFLGEARELVLGAERLDAIPAPLSIEATRLLIDRGSALYRFRVTAGGCEILCGRASVFLDAAAAVKRTGAPA